MISYFLEANQMKKLDSRFKHSGMTRINPLFLRGRRKEKERFLTALEMTGVLVITLPNNHRHLD